MSEASPLRVALLGTGSIAQVVHLPILSSLDGVAIQAVCDVDRPRAAAIAGRFGIPKVLETDQAAFRDDEVEAVVICTPSHLHEEQAIGALEAGKHVLVEKPLALDAKGAERVLRAAETSGRTLMVAMNNRYRPDVVALRPFALGGELGQPFLIKAGWLNRKVRVLRPTWRHRLATAGGGALMDLGIQVLDLCLWLLGYPKVERVVAKLHPGEGMEVEDAAAVLLGLEGGAVLTMEVSWSLLANRDRQYLRILGSHGSAALHPLTVFKEVEHGLLDVTPQVQPGRENLYTASYRHELTAFVAAARGESPSTLPREQVDLMRTIAHAYRSAQEGRELEL
jgi:predicted dehydrogenase